MQRHEDLLRVLYQAQLDQHDRILMWVRTRIDMAMTGRVIEVKTKEEGDGYIRGYNKAISVVREKFGL